MELGADPGAEDRGDAPAFAAHDAPEALVAGLPRIATGTAARRVAEALAVDVGKAARL